MATAYRSSFSGFNRSSSSPVLSFSHAHGSASITSLQLGHHPVIAVPAVGTDGFVGLSMTFQDGGVTQTERLAKPLAHGSVGSIELDLTYAAEIQQPVTS